MQSADFCIFSTHIFTIDLSNVNQHPNYLFAVNQHLSSPRIDNPRILMDFFKNSDPNSVVVSSIYYLCRIKIFLWPYVDFHGVVGHKYNRNAGKSIRIPRSSVFFRQELWKSCDLCTNKVFLWPYVDFRGVVRCQRPRLLLATAAAHSGSSWRWRRRFLLTQ